MADLSSLKVLGTETFDTWRERYNQLCDSLGGVNSVGEISSLDEDIPTAYRASLITAINYIFQLSDSTGLPMTESNLFNCRVPTDSSLYFGSVLSSFAISRSLTSGLNVTYTTDGETSNYFKISDSGYVGIGKTNPLYKLDVNGTVNAEQYRIENSSIASVYTCSVYSLNSVNYTVHESSTNILTRLAINNSKIFDVSGTGKFAVGYSSYEDINDEDDNILYKTANGVLSVLYRAAQSFFRTTISTASMIFTFKNVNFMSVLEDGKVGINKLNPLYTLDIQGDVYSVNARVGSVFYVGSSSIFENLGSGTIRQTMPANSTLTHNGNTIINASSKIPISAISINDVLNLNQVSTRPTSGIVNGSVVFDSNLGIPIVYRADLTQWTNFMGDVV